MVCARDRTLLWFGHGCVRHHMCSGMDVTMVCACFCKDARVIVCAPEWTSVWFGHGCAGHGMRSGRDVLNYGLGMDVLLIAVTTWNTNVTMVWAWMLS